MIEPNRFTGDQTPPPPTGESLIEKMKRLENLQKSLRDLRETKVFDASKTIDDLKKAIAKLEQEIEQIADETK